MFHRAATLLRKGVVLDIDGVLIRGGQEIAGARKALQILDEKKVPYVFLTNGSGMEERKASQVSHIIGYDVDPKRVIVSHTPMREWDTLKDERFLLCSKPAGVDAMRSYGYTHAVWSTDHMAQFPKQTPLRTAAPPTTPHPDGNALKVPCDATPYGAVAVLGEPADWYAEIQLITDVLRTDPKTMELTNTQHAPLYWFNDDMTFAGGHKHPRLAGGALLSCLQTVYKELTGKHIKVEKYGKPHAVQYRYAERVLAGLDGTLSQILCVGDNLLSDIEGANGAGEHFTSVLVLSGINEECPKPGEVPSKHLPDLVYDDVLEFTEDLVAGDAHLDGPTDAPSKFASADVSVITGDHCPLCDDGIALLGDLGVCPTEVPLSSLPPEDQERHALRIPVFILATPSGPQEIGHGRITLPTLQWKLNKYHK